MDTKGSDNAEVRSRQSDNITLLDIGCLAYIYYHNVGQVLVLPLALLSAVRVLL
jgi:hypothetical protein